MSVGQRKPQTKADALRSVTTQHPLDKRPDSATRATRGTPSREELEKLRQQIVDLISDKPEKAAIILTDWLKGATSTSSTKKKAG